MDWKTYKKAMLALMVIISLVLAGMSGILVPISMANAGEVGPNVVVGKVLSIQTHFARSGTIEVKSNHTGKVYTFYVGSRTAYYPRRYPGVGETIRVHYVNDRGYLKATRVEIL